MCGLFAIEETVSRKPSRIELETFARQRTKPFKDHTGKLYEYFFFLLKLALGTCSMLVVIYCQYLEGANAVHNGGLMYATVRLQSERLFPQLEPVTFGHNGAILLVRQACPSKSPIKYSKFFFKITH